MADRTVRVMMNTCANCEKALHGKILQCSACKKTCYCNRDCQKSHWKFHKIRCKQLQQVKQDSIETHQKRVYRLFQEFKNASRETMVATLLDFFGKETMASMEPERCVIFFKLDFDYNSRTFVPIEPPEIVNACSLPSNESKQIIRLYDEAKFAPRPSNLPSYMRNVRFAPVIAYMQYAPGNRALISTNMIQLDDDDDDEPRISFNKMVDEFKTTVTLTSKKFDKWKPLRDENLDTQINAIRQNDNFSHFVSAALHMPSPKTRKNLTHIVQISLLQGFGLGEIKSIEGYKVITRKMAKKLAKHHEAEDVAKTVLDEKADTKAVALLISDNICSFVVINVICTPDNERTPEQCDREAKDAFACLKRVKLPTVQMHPPLH